MKQAEARKLWLEAVERVKDRTLAPTLWRALEMGQGITVDDGAFIIGFNPGDLPMGGYLMSSEHRIIIERVISELLKSDLRIKIIDGSTQADYESHKKREEIAAATRQKALERKHVERASDRAWEVVAEQCSRKYARTELRQLPQIRAQYLMEAIQIMSEAMDRIHPEGNMDDAGHRALARVVEKVATLADVPSAVVGMELLRVRDLPARKTIETKSEGTS